jgi:hypothetical protein
MDKPAPLGMDDYFRELESQLRDCKKVMEWQRCVVDAPFSDPRMAALLGLGLVSLLMVNKPNRTIERIAFTENDISRNIIEMSDKPIEQLKIPLNYPTNFVAKAIRQNHYMITTDWQYLFNPKLSPDQARLIQAGGGIACSVIYPLPHIADKGALIFSFYETIARIGRDHHNFMTRYSSLVQRVFDDLPKA